MHTRSLLLTQTMPHTRQYDRWCSTCLYGALWCSIVSGTRWGNNVSVTIVQASHVWYMSNLVQSLPDSTRRDMNQAEKLQQAITLLTSIALSAPGEDSTGGTSEGDGHSTVQPQSSHGFRRWQCHGNMNCLKFNNITHRLLAPQYIYLHSMYATSGMSTVV